MRITFHKIAVSFLLSVVLILAFTGTSKAATASLSLSPSSGTYSVGQTINVNINLNTGGARTSGADVELTFTSSTLRLDDITNGTIYAQYVGEVINNNDGTAGISGLSGSAQNLFQGTGTLATLKFTAIANGAASINIDYTSGNANDSNVADFDTQTDILGSVAGASFTISGSGTTSTGTGTSGSGTGAGSTGSSSLPDTGVFEVFLGLSLVALVLVGVGVFLGARSRKVEV